MKQLTKDEFFKQLQDYVSAADSQRAAARNLGISPCHLNDVLRNRKEPGPKIASALGLRAVTNYVPIDHDDDQKED